jgi:hypothetical protein
MTLKTLYHLASMSFTRHVTKNAARAERLQISS